MGTAELTCRSTHASVTKMDARLRCRAATHALRLALVYALLWTITLLGALLGTAFPGLAPGGRPHPALQESWGELASIAADNARVLSAPFLLAFFRFPAHPRTRQFGDLLIAGVLGANALRVGLALGRWHTRLLPYVPQLPLEWLAAALAGAAWLALTDGRSTADGDRLPGGSPRGRHSGRGGRDDRNPPRPRPHAQRRAGFDDRGTSFSGPHPCAEGRGWIAFARIVRRRRQSLQGRFASFPSLSLGSAQPSGRRCRATSTTPGSRKGGTTVNAVHLIGRITQDITVREHGDTKVAQLRLAVPRGRDKNGEDRGADFVDVVCFGRQAEVCADYLTKGRRIAVEGRLHHDEWDGENGRRQKLEVIAQSVEFLDARKADGEPAEQTEPAAA